MKNKNRGVERPPSRLEMVELIESLAGTECGAARILPIARDVLVEILDDEKDRANNWSCFDNRELTDTVLRFICAYRIPVEGSAYFNLETDCVSYLDFYSKSNLSKSGGAVRVPRAVNGFKLAERLRAQGSEVFIVENVYELRLWISIWGGSALIATALMKVLDEMLD
ncbi:hypothetical protein E6B08_17425 [Pseudomonas putida]|uniref:Uncharacterized protein n=1 Tax=Pseudomonas putida TaxID=303 RepID=A0A4D6XFK1_PSEPU|nr:hypothetical protein [Pseudomonas putida]QCI13041.1 hypothetical protein E6B08_17425 [Pseudomonas putida]